MKRVARWGQFACLLLLASGMVLVVQAQPYPEPDTGPYRAGVRSQEAPPAPTEPPAPPEAEWIVKGMPSDTPATAVSVPAPATPISTDGDVRAGVGSVSNSVPAAPQLNGASDSLCLPHSPITINFDDQAQPDVFSNTTALRYDYRASGIVFSGSTALNGGAILDQSSSFGVSGFSAPNFLAFNDQSTLSDGGIPEPPQRIDFLGKASFVQVLGGSSDLTGGTIMMEAFDANGVSLGADSIVATAALQPLSVTAEHIAAVVITSNLQTFVLDDLTFVPEAIPALINFDDSPQPAGFSLTTALRDAYSAQGVLFDGPDTLDGGAILDEGSNFDVTGYSAPNFLAFNKSATLSDGGTPTPPETIEFVLPVTAVQAYLGAGFGQTGTFEMEAFNADGSSVGTVSVAVGRRLQPLTIMGKNIVRVVVDAGLNTFVLDDLLFIRQDAAYIDFDDASEPGAFNASVALRDKYQVCGARFNPSIPLDGGAILDQSGNFGVSGFSPRNFLAFNDNATLSDGGQPVPPEVIKFVRPANFVQLRAGAGFVAGRTITLRAFAADNSLLDTVTVTMTANMQPLAISAEGIDRAIITSNADIFVIDDLTFVLEPIYDLFLPVIIKGG